MSERERERELINFSDRERERELINFSDRERERERGQRTAKPCSPVHYGDIEWGIDNQESRIINPSIVPLYHTPASASSRPYNSNHSFAQSTYLCSALLRRTVSYLQNALVIIMGFEDGSSGVDTDVLGFVFVFVAAVAISLAMFRQIHATASSSVLKTASSSNIPRRKKKRSAKGSFGLSLHEAYWFRRQNRVDEEEDRGTNIAIDMSFEGSMDKRERKSLATQTAIVYADFRRAPIRARLFLTSYRDSMKAALTRLNAFQWDPSIVTLTSESFLDACPKWCNSVVYLSPDAEEVIDDVRSDTLYVIGGLVDRTRLKNMSLARASSLGVRSARLPIKSFGHSRKTDGILYITTVARGLLLKCQNGAREWDGIWDEVLPKRRTLVDDASSNGAIRQNEWTALPTRAEIMANEIFPDFVKIRSYNFKLRVLQIARFGLKPTFRSEADTSRPYARRWVAHACVVQSATGALDPSFSQNAEGFGPTKKAAIAMSSWALIHANPKIQRFLGLSCPECP